MRCLLTYWVKVSLRISGWISFVLCLLVFLPGMLRFLILHSHFFHCRKIFSDDRSKLEEAELANALTEITAEHNSVIQTNTTTSKAWWTCETSVPLKTFFLQQQHKARNFSVPLTTHFKQHFDWLQRTLCFIPGFTHELFTVSPKEFVGDQKRFILFFYCYLTCQEY